jgi:hypothetical protein
MAESTSFYLRLPNDLKARVQEYATTRERNQLSEAAVDLIASGLNWQEQARERTAANEEREALTCELVLLKQKVEHFERERGVLADKLSTSEQRRELAEQSLQNYYEQIQAFNYWLSVPIARCKDCNGEVNFRDVASAQCPNRPGQLSQGYEFLPQYQGKKEFGEVVRDLSAVVGAATVLVALANSRR